MWVPREGPQLHHQPCPSEAEPVVETDIDTIIFSGVLETALKPKF